MTHFKIYTNTEELPDDWDQLTAHDILLQTGYLKALQNALPPSISLYFIGIFKAEKLSGLALVQRVELYAKDMFRSKSSSRANRVFKDAVSRILKGNILVVGNLTHTGQHGIFFNNDRMSQKEFLQSLFEALDALKRAIKRKNNKTIRAILFKDYFQEDAIHLERAQFKQRQFYHVNVQPNMLFFVPQDWHHMDDYLDALNTKYKTRFKRARKKLGSIERRELSIDTIQRESKRLYELYKNVSDNASFNTFVLPKNHFYSLKLELKDNFRVFGYYLKDELIGFYTMILNGDTLETYFLGYNEMHQYDNQLYLNMLYDMIAFGIHNRFRTIVYARTAMEIKSSVGATPKAVSMYIKHTNHIINPLLNPIFKLMNPLQDWEERHPFKTNL